MNCDHCGVACREGHLCVEFLQGQIDKLRSRLQALEQNTVPSREQKHWWIVEYEGIACPAAFPNFVAADSAARAFRGRVIAHTVQVL